MSDLIVLYQTPNGAAVSVGSTQPPTIPAGMAVKIITNPTWEQFAAGGWLWDPATLTVAPIPVPVTVTVSANLRTKGANNLAYNVNTGLPGLATAVTACDAVIASSPGNLAAAVTQLKNLANVVKGLAQVDQRGVRFDNAITRLLLGDFYGEPDTYLSTEDGT